MPATGRTWARSLVIGVAAAIVAGVASGLSGELTPAGVAALTAGAAMFTSALTLAAERGPLRAAGILVVLGLVSAGCAVFFLQSARSRVTAVKVTSRIPEHDLAPSEKGQQYLARTVTITRRHGTNVYLASDSAGRYGFNVDDVIRVMRKGSSTPLYTNDFSDHCKAYTIVPTVEPANIGQKLPFDTPIDLEITLSDECGVSYSSSSIFIVIR